MTLELLKQAGMQIRSEPTQDGSGDTIYVIPAHSEVTAKEISTEPDASSAFAIAATGVARAGLVEIESWPELSLQSDAVFPGLLTQMGCTSSSKNGWLQVDCRERTLLKPIDFNLLDAPDLFPVLAVLCSIAEGRSRLFGAPHLAHKESNRIAKTAELVKALGRKVKILPDGLEIEGRSELKFPPSFRYSTDHDHRLAMAAAVARSAGAEIEIQEPKVVDKSFPGFWRAIESGSI